MLIIFALLLALIALDVAAARWGADSREDLRSKEWERRQMQAFR